MNELQHYGVKGMKWGVIRTPEQLGRREENNRKKAIASDKKKIASKGEIGKKKVSDSLKSLSDSELKARINRLNMERQYLDLVKAPEQKLTKGQEKAMEVLTTLGRTFAAQVGKASGEWVSKKTFSKGIAKAEAKSAYAKTKAEKYYTKKQTKTDKTRREKEKKEREDAWLKARKRAMASL